MARVFFWLKFVFILSLTTHDCTQNFFLQEPSAPLKFVNLYTPLSTKVSDKIQLLSSDLTSSYTVLPLRSVLLPDIADNNDKTEASLNTSLLFNTTERSQHNKTSLIFNDKNKTKLFSSSINNTIETNKKTSTPFATFSSSIVTSFTLTIFTEFGDRTFFIAAILSLRHSKWIVLSGTCAALIIQTIFSTLLGQLLHILPNNISKFTSMSLPIDDYAAAILLFVFGIIHLRAACHDNVNSTEDLSESNGQVGKQQNHQDTAYHQIEDDLYTQKNTSHSQHNASPKHNCMPSTNNHLCNGVSDTKQYNMSSNSPLNILLVAPLSEKLSLLPKTDQLLDDCSHIETQHGSTLTVLSSTRNDNEISENLSVRTVASCIHPSEPIQQESKLVHLTAPILYSGIQNSNVEHDLKPPSITPFPATTTHVYSSQELSNFNHISENICNSTKDASARKSYEYCEAEKSAKAFEVRRDNYRGPPRDLDVFKETFWVIFFAELGDKSMISTVALATAQNPYGVFVGSSIAHCIITMLAVIAGSLLEPYVSERIANIIGAVLFITFAVMTTLEGLARQGILLWWFLGEKLSALFVAYYLTFGTTAYHTASVITTSTTTGSPDILNSAHHFMHMLTTW